MDSSQHYTTEEIERFAQDTHTPSEEARRANAHFAQCATCRAAFRAACEATSAPITALLLPEEEPAECLDIDLIDRYVQGKADPFDTEIVETHLEYCPFCKEEVDTQQIFRNHIETLPLPIASPAASETTQELPPLHPREDTKISFGEWLRRFFLLPQVAWSAAGVCAACLLAALTLSKSASILPDAGLAHRLAASEKRVDELQKNLQDNQTAAETQEQQLRAQIAALEKNPGSNEEDLSRLRRDLEQLRLSGALALEETKRYRTLAFASANVVYNRYRSKAAVTLSGGHTPDIAPVSPSGVILTNTRPALTIRLSPEKLRKEGLDYVVLEVTLSYPDRRNRRSGSTGVGHEPVDRRFYVEVNRRTLPASGQVTLELKEPLPVNTEYEWSIQGYSGKLSAATGKPEQEDEPLADLTSDSAWFLLLDRQRASDPLQRAVVLAAGEHRTAARAELTKALQNPRLPAAERRIAEQMLRDLKNLP